VAAHHRRGRRGPPLRSHLVAGLLIGLILGGGLVAAAAVPLSNAPPELVLSIARVPTGTSNGILPFPVQGESALAIPSLHVFEATKGQSPVPIASITKLTNAYVTLHVLPLTPTEAGPSYVVSEADVTLYHHDFKTGQSCIKVANGEVLTERQLLDGMLVHSANNFASMLGTLVAGSDDAMVTLMNDTANSLGMTASSYVDVTGLDPASRSNAVDVLHLSMRLMHNPTFTEIVRQTSILLPVAGIVSTFTPYLGKPGVVGIKTGSTQEALGCMSMAFDASAAGRTVQIIDVVLGQSSSIPGRDLVAAAGHSALVLASAAAHQLGSWRVTTAHETVGSIGWSASTVPVVAGSTIEVPTFDGVPATSSVTEVPWSANKVTRGQLLATVVVTSGTYRQVSRITAGGTLIRPSVWQRLR